MERIGTVRTNTDRCKQLNGLAKFIQEEMDNRRQSMREFARKVGVSHATISRLLSGEEKMPDLEFLVKLSRATNVDISRLVLLVIGSDVGVSPEDVESQILLARIQRLSRDDRKIIEAFIARAGFEGSDQTA